MPRFLERPGDYSAGARCGHELRNALCICGLPHLTVDLRVGIWAPLSARKDSPRSSHLGLGTYRSRPTPLRPLPLPRLARQLLLLLHSSAQCHFLREAPRLALSAPAMAL